MEKEIERLLPLAEAGIPQAQYDLGTLYWKNENLKDAVHWLEKSAHQEHPKQDRAQWQLGVCYFYGKGVQENKVSAIEWFRKSADKGFALAQLYLGRCYYEGVGVLQDHEEAVRWLGKAAEQRQALAQYYLGKCSLYGKGVPENREEAIAWLQKAANQGLAVAENLLQVIQGNNMDEN